MGDSRAKQWPCSIRAMPKPNHPSLKTSPVRVFARLGLILLTLALCAGVDYGTGYEISVFLLYVIPVSLTTRFFGTTAGGAMAMGATAVWMAVDRLSGHQYSQEWIWFVNAGNRMMCFLLAVWAIGYFQARQNQLKRKLEAFSGALPICTQCQRLGADDGYWWEVEVYLKEFGEAQPQHKVCPDCARHAYARGGYREVSQQGA